MELGDYERNTVIVLLFVWDKESLRYLPPTPAKYMCGLTSRCFLFLLMGFVEVAGEYRGAQCVVFGRWCLDSVQIVNNAAREVHCLIVLW